MWTRREFLSIMAARTAARAAGSPHQGEPPASWASFPFSGLVARFRTDQLRPRLEWTPTGLGRDDYLRVIQGIVRFFAGYQDARGAIIDPYEKKERQYSTPAFALAGAALVASGRDATLLPACVRAMDAASADLADAKAADGHADFFTILLVHADIILRRVVPEQAAAAWGHSLARIVPERIYRYQPAAPQIHNWNLVAASGEWLRTREGYGQSGAWIEASLARQMPHFTPAGMYRDPADPMAYDHFARLWALDLVEEGYTGQYAGAVADLVERGAWASLFMQSPWGELPCGGRSAHHQWNETEQAVTFETFAARAARRGDLAAAGAFKRAAHLSLQSVKRWIRPTGELWIVKNRRDPAVRHGYEYYSFHSQYNLLAAAMLALAWLRADDRIAEKPCPADTGGFGFALQPPFHKVFLAAAGTSAVIDTGADLHYNPTGILRVHHRAIPPETLSDGTTAGCEYQVPAKPDRGIALGPAWRDRDGRWHALAEHAGEDLDPAAFRLVRAAPDRVEAEVTYRGRLRGGAAAIHERVRLAPGVVEFEHVVEGDVGAVRHVYPLLVTDGLRESVISIQGSAVEVAREEGRIRFAPQDRDVSVSRLGVAEPCRNGFMDAAVAEAKSRSIRSRLTVGRAAP